MGIAFLLIDIILVIILIPYGIFLVWAGVLYFKKKPFIIRGIVIKFWLFFSGLGILAEGTVLNFNSEMPIFIKIAITVILALFIIFILLRLSYFGNFFIYNIAVNELFKVTEHSLNDIGLVFTSDMLVIYFSLQQANLRLGYNSLLKMGVLTFKPSKDLPIKHLYYFLKSNLYYLNQRKTPGYHYLFFLFGLIFFAYGSWLIIYHAFLS